MSKKMTQKELQQMLDSFQKEVTIKDYEIDRLQRLNGDFKVMSERSKKNHKAKLESGWYKNNKKKYQEHANNNFRNLSEEKEKQKRENISKSNKKIYHTNESVRKNLDRTGQAPPNKKIEDYVGDWMLVQYERKRDLFGKKIGFQRIADCMGVSVGTANNVIKKAMKRRVQNDK